MEACLPMIQSMTGFGAGAVQRNGRTVAVEIKTLNHRFLDLHVRIGREFAYLEEQIQQLIRNALNRGRVEVYVTIQSSGSGSFVVNSELVRGYLEAADRLKEEFNLQESLDLKTVLSLPGIIQTGDSFQAEDAELLSQLLQECMQAALRGVLGMRTREGEALRRDMLQNLKEVQESTKLIRELSSTSAAEHFEKLRERIAQLLPQGVVDPERMIQEAALLADRSDISEEIARLESHIEQFRILMDAGEKTGKRLDFLLQELQREANTILSKAWNLEISQQAISIKTNIEKLREQVQNVE